MAGRRLLVVDDEAEFRELVRKVAEPLGYAVALAADAEQFKQAYQEADPDAIVLDVVMPEVDGVELVQWLAQRGCRAKVVVVTGFNPHYAELARVLGTERGLPEIQTFTKPIKLADLRAALS